MSSMKIWGSALYQWERGRKIQVIPHKNTTATAVQFAHPGDAEALPVKLRNENGVIVADIPNVLLQSDQEIIAFLVDTDDGNIETTTHSVFRVIGRPKPSDYVYTETEVLNYGYLDKRISELEGEGLSKAVADYLEKNPVEGGATAEEKEQIEQNALRIDGVENEIDNMMSNYALKSEIPSVPVESVNGKTGAVDLTAFDVHALPDTTSIPRKTSDLTNDSGYLTEHQDLTGYAKKSEVPTKTSELQNDSGYLTEVPNGYAKTEDIPTDDHINELVDTKLEGFDVPSGGSSTTWELISETVVETEVGWLTINSFDLTRNEYFAVILVPQVETQINAGNNRFMGSRAVRAHTTFAMTTGRMLHMMYANKVSENEGMFIGYSAEKSEGFTDIWGRTNKTAIVYGGYEVREGMAISNTVPVGTHIKIYAK